MSVSFTVHFTVRRISQFEPPFKLPPIDPSGPHLVTGTAPQTLEEVEVRSVVSERKVSILQEVEGKLHPPQQEIEKKALPRHTWSLSEARFASSGILSKLKKQLVLFKDKEDFEITLPEEIVEFLSQKYEGLVADTVVEKREWQTGCYLEYKSKNKHPFLTSTGKEAASAGEGVSRADIESALKGVANKTGKKVTMSKETKKEQHVHPERPQTARSIMSNFSFKSEPSEDATSTFTTDYDRLPEELRPNILNYRRESLMPKMKRMGPQTRMERAKGQHEDMKSLRAKKEKEEKSKKEKEEMLKMEQQSEKKSMREFLVHSNTVEPLYKGQVGDRSFVPYTVEPLYKGQVDPYTVEPLYKEEVLCPLYSGASDKLGIGPLYTVEQGTSWGYVL